MPTMFSKLIEKAKPKFSCYGSKAGSTSSNENHNIFHLNGNMPAAAITTHVFGYRDGIKDNYVEPPLSKKIQHVLVSQILT